MAAPTAVAVLLADRAADAPALGDAEHGWWSGAQLRRAVTAAAAALSGPPRRVPLELPNRVPAVVDLLAHVQAGHRVYLENPSQTAAERRAGRAALAAGAADSAAAGVLIRTSGSTGTPKLVPLDAAQLLGNAAAMARRKGLGPGDVVLCAIPIFHANGLVASLLSGLASGAAVWLSDRLAPPALLDVVAARGITMVSGVPTLWQQLLELGDASRQAFATVRLGSSGAAPLSEALAARTEAHLGLKLLEGYGLSEATCGVCGTPPGDRRPGWVGPPLDGVEIRIVAPGDQLAPLGSAGEIQVRGPFVMRGYDGDPAATAAAFTADGWLRSGDLGEQGGDGFVRIVGRLKHLIIRSGFNVVPREVEEAIRATGLVRDAAVVGRPHGRWGEEVCAAVVAADPATARDLPARLDAVLRDALSGYKRPTTIVVVDAVPATPAGKPDLPAVRALVADATKAG